MDTLRQYRNRIEKVYGENDYWMVPIFRSFFVILLLAFLSRFFRMGGTLPALLLLYAVLSFAGAWYGIFCFCLSFAKQF